MSDGLDYPSPPDFEGVELEQAIAQGRICRNCVFWGPNADPSRDWYPDRARCYGKEMNDYSSDHVPNTEPQDACGDFTSTHEKQMYRVDFPTIAAYVEAVGVPAAKAKARGMCGQKPDVNCTWEVVKESSEE
jgi:hypothetical protein